MMTRYPHVLEPLRLAVYALIALAPAGLGKELHQFLFHRFLRIEIRVFAHLLVKRHVILDAGKLRALVIVVQRAHVAFKGTDFGGDV